MYLLFNSILEGQSVEIVGMSQMHKITIPEFSDPKGPIYRNCINTDGKFQDALVTDPVEDRYVYINESIINGYGLFAKIDIPKGTNFAYFGGQLYTAQAWNDTTFFDPQYFMKFEDGKQLYYIHLPDEYWNDLNKYRATLGHKINHGFFSDNANTVASFHPRFGLIGMFTNNMLIIAIFGHHFKQTFIQER